MQTELTKTEENGRNVWYGYIYTSHLVENVSFIWRSGRVAWIILQEQHIYCKSESKHPEHLD